jgi:hypothetical protein
VQFMRHCIGDSMLLGAGAFDRAAAARTMQPGC